MGTLTFDPNPPPTQQLGDSIISTKPNSDAHGFPFSAEFPH